MRSADTQRRYRELEAAGRLRTRPAARNPPSRRESRMAMLDDPSYDLPILQRRCVDIQSGAFRLTYPPHRSRTWCLGVGFGASVEGLRDSARQKHCAGARGEWLSERIGKAAKSGDDCGFGNADFVAYLAGSSAQDKWRITGERRARDMGRAG